MAVLEKPRSTPTPEPPPPRRVYPGGRSARVWRWTVISGIALIFLAGVHMIAQHFIVNETGGLRTYQQVLDYISNPVIFVIEGGFLVAVAIHGMLGLRGVLHDLDPSPRARARIDRVLWVLGTATVAYGFFLITTLALRA
ncbi:MAG: succinate dehydrogenase, hydrophobic membrane anchor protein [Thermoleophilaceae bacterium]